MSALWRLSAYECRALLFSRSSWFAWLALLFAGLLAIAQGNAVIETQRELIDELPELYQQDVNSVQQRSAVGTDPGYTAYYLFHPTSHAPAPLASFSLGVRDSLPAAMKVRMLGLYSQLFDAELVNPVTASAGPFDFSFFVIFILPVWLIVLCHGVLAREEEDGMGPLIRSQGSSMLQLLWVRVCLRLGLTVAVLVLLVLMGVVLTPVSLSLELLAWTLLSVLYLIFWASLCCLVVSLRRSSVWTAMVLLSIWAVLILILPSTLNTWVERTYPVNDAALLMLEQRQAVHSGWDLPKEETFEKFFITHPEWSDTPPVTERFHWKWYYAMHQVGDESVQHELDALWSRLGQRDQLTGLLSVFLPTVGAQRGMTGLAQSDLVDHLHYLGSVASFHEQLRAFFYPLIFNEQPFLPADFQRVPVHSMEERPVRWPWLPAVGIIVWSALLLFITRRRFSR